jgi:hypothetical protein
MAVDAERSPEIRTLPPEIVAGHLRRIHILRDTALGLVALLTIIGATGLLGVRSGSEAVSAVGYDVQFEYPEITRGGLSADFDLRVARAGGFGGTQVTIACDKQYLELFDIQWVFPAPIRQTSDRSLVYWTFEPSPSDVLDVSFTTQTGESLDQVGVHDAEAQVLTGGTPVARIPFRTVVVP